MPALRALSALLLSALLASGCASDAPEPADVAEQLLASLRSGEPDAHLAHLTPLAREATARGRGLSLADGTLDAYTVGAATAEGERATVAVTLTQGGETQEARLLLRRHAGAWAVHGLEVSFGDRTLTLDLEAETSLVERSAGGTPVSAAPPHDAQREPAGSRGSAADERARFLALAGVTPQAHEAAWRIDLDAGGRSAFDAIVEVATGTGIGVDPGTAGEELLRPVDLQLTGVSRIEAIERVAAAVGAVPSWPGEGVAFRDGPPMLRFVAGARTRPTAFAGPFLVEVSRLVEDAPNAVGSLDLTVHALGLHEAVLAHQAELVELVRTDRVRGPQGEALAEESVRHLGTPRVRGGYLTASIDEELTGLLSGVDRLDVTGEVRLPLPVAVETLRWERGAPGPSRLECGTLALERWGTSVRFRLTPSRPDDVGALRVRSSPLGPGGAPLPVRAATSFGAEGTVTATVECSEPPAAVELAICRTATVVEPFELRGVALARSRQQPSALRALEFEGPAPLALALGSLDLEDAGGPRVTVIAESTANKDAVSFTVDLVYLDEAGRELDHFPHTLTGSPLAGSPLPGRRSSPAVPAGTRRELTTRAALLPAGTQDVELRLREVEFPDGSRWPDGAL